MLLIKTHLGDSKISGMGVFASEFIPKGTLIWQLEAGFDRIFRESDIRCLPDRCKEWIRHYGYRIKNSHGYYVVCMDNAKYFNHSDEPNTDDTGPLGSVADRDIEAGEELTCDYYEFDLDAEIKLAP